MVIKGIQKRPFIRPLFIWITGILLQAFFDCSVVSLLLIIIPLLIVAFSYLIPKVESESGNYELRWVWGAVFLSLLLSLSIQRTAYWQEAVPRRRGEIAVKHRF